MRCDPQELGDDHIRFALDKFSRRTIAAIGAPAASLGIDVWTGN
jgi:hypothetical protein